MTPEESEKKERQLIAVLKEGVSYRKIAALFDVSMPTLITIARREGIKRAHYGGESNPKRDKQIIKEIKQGLPYKEIASHYGISDSWVWKLAKRNGIKRGRGRRSLQKGKE
jgi:transposase